MLRGPRIADRTSLRAPPSGRYVNRTHRRSALPLGPDGQRRVTFRLLCGACPHAARPPLRTTHQGESVSALKRWALAAASAVIPCPRDRPTAQSLAGLPKPNYATVKIDPPSGRVAGAALQTLKLRSVNEGGVVERRPHGGSAVVSRSLAGQLGQRPNRCGARARRSGGRAYLQRHGPDRLSDECCSGTR